MPGQMALRVVDTSRYKNAPKRVILATQKDAHVFYEAEFYNVIGITKNSN
jgi:hypothetical protein